MANTVNYNIEQPVKGTQNWHEIVNENMNKIDTEIKNRANEIGTLANLETTDKTSVVNATNENVNRIGLLSTLTTTDKTDLVHSVNEINEQLAENATQLSDLTTVYASSFKTISNDWGEAINDAINSITTGKVILPKGTLIYSSPIMIKSNIELVGQGIDITILNAIGCHGISVISNQYLRYAKIKDLSLLGDNDGDYSIYDNTKNGINLNTIIESYRCEIDNVKVTNFKGKGIYADYDFNNVYRRFFISHCGGNGIEINGLNTCTLENGYVEYVANGKCGYRVYQNAVIISCNGLGGNGDYWGIFGRNNGLYEDSNNGIAIHNITFINCNIEDFKKIGCIFLYAGGFNFISTIFYAPSSGTFDYYIKTDNINKMSLIDGLTLLQTKGATQNYASKIFSVVTTPQLLVYNDTPNFTTDGTTLFKIPKISSVYDSYLQGALEFDYINIKGMTYYYHGGKKHTTASAIPTTGTWNIGDTVHNTNPIELGTSGSKYIVERWKCAVTGTPGTWLECRTLTGN